MCEVVGIGVNKGSMGVGVPRGCQMGNVAGDGEGCDGVMVAGVGGDVEGSGKGEECGWLWGWFGGVLTGGAEGVEGEGDEDEGGDDAGEEGVEGETEPGVGRGWVEGHGSLARIASSSASVSGSGSRWRR